MQGRRLRRLLRGGRKEISKKKTSREAGIGEDVSFKENFKRKDFT
jgi:hypothetical protein